MDFWQTLGAKVLAKVDEGLVAFLLLISTAVIAFIKRIPAKVIHEYRRRKQLVDIAKGSEINNIIRKLKVTGALFIHIIKYHNGGPYKMTVEWEAVGDPCHYCKHQCTHFKNGKVQPLQKHWVNQRVSNVWAHIIGKTLHLNGGLNTFTIGDFDKLVEDPEKHVEAAEIENHKAIFRSANIEVFKENLLIMSGKDSYTLGLSYCPQAVITEENDIDQLMAARLLKKALKK